MDTAKCKELRRLVHFAEDLITVVDASTSGTIVDGNATWSRRLGYSREDFIGRPFAEFVHPDDIAQARRHIAEIASKSMTGTLEERIICADGSPVWYEQSITLFPDATIWLIGRDIAERKALESRALEESTADPLTGCLNRRGLEQYLSTVTGSIVAIMVDVDDFKSVNDRFGHERGDRVLSAVGQILSRSTRPADAAARIGGDEFLVIVSGADCLSVAEGIAHRFRDGLALSFGTADPVTCSVAIARCRSVVLSEIQHSLSASFRAAKSKTGKNQIVTCPSIAGFERVISPQE